MNTKNKKTLYLTLTSILILIVGYCLFTGGVSPEAQSTGVSSTTPLGLVLAPSGEFKMGDHHGFVDPKHGGDETPIHTVKLDAFYIGINTVTTQEYCDFLNSSLAQKQIELRKGGIYLIGSNDLFFETNVMSPYSRIAFNGTTFYVLYQKEDHPIVCIRWPGAAAYCNWLSQQKGLQPCYDITTWNCDLNMSSYRLPTEAEWEYAARGGQNKPYRNFPWGDDANANKANWPQSKNPYRFGPYPWTTPAGFFNGQLHSKSDFGWPGPQKTYQTSNGMNGYGLNDMAGNVWEFVNDWYVRDYYSYSPIDNPPGPERGSQMHDGKPYRGMRGGNWYNGEDGHSRVSNRNPSYYRGPEDPNHPYYHLGFRIVLPINAESRQKVNLTPVKHVKRNERGQGRHPQREFQQDSRQPDRSKFQETDSNSDGSVSLEEYLSHEEKKFERIDTDGNKVLTPLEVEVDERQQSRNENRGRNDRFERMDTDRNDLVSLDEYLASEKSQFQRHDTNGDGVLSNQEMDTGRPGDLNRPHPQRRVDHDRRAMNPPHPDRPGNNRRPPEHRNPPGGQGQKEKTTLDINVLSEGKLGLVSSTNQAAPGYTLFAPKHRTMTYLIDNQGQMVHVWTQSEYEPGQSVYLLENGNLLRCCFTHAQGFTRGGEGGRLEEYDWDGNLVWEFDYASNEYMLHHDIAVLPNGNILALAVERKSKDECITAGFIPTMLRDPELYPDFVVEIEPTRPKGGNIVWEWHVWDHLIQDQDPQKANYGNVAEHPERVDVNCNDRPIPAFWNHMNSIAYNTKLDQIMLSVRGCNELWIIDHSTTIKEAANRTGGRYGKGGDILYRWGNPAAYKQGDRRSRQLFEQHDAHWIPDGSPGAGNILIFNNGQERGYSSIEEIAPPVDENGNYEITAGKPYGPNRPIWNYTAANRMDFFSSEISGAHRLPNGNTLICAGVLGTFFEVTPNGETVWKYVNPVVRGGTLAQGEKPGVDDRGHYLNAVFKVHRYPPDYKGLTGKDLSPTGVIEQPSSMKGKTGLDGVNTSPSRGHRPIQDQETEIEDARSRALRSLGYF